MVTTDVRILNLNSHRSLQLLQTTKSPSENSATTASGLPQLRNPDAWVATVSLEVKAHLSNRQATSHKWKSKVGSMFHLSQEENIMAYTVRLCSLPGWGCPPTGYSHQAQVTPSNPLSTEMNLPWLVSAGCLPEPLSPLFYIPWTCRDLPRYLQRYLWSTCRGSCEHICAHTHMKKAGLYGMKLPL